MLKSLIITIFAVMVYSVTAFSFNGYKNYILKFNPKVNITDIYDIGYSTINAGQEYNIDPVMILAVMKVESYFNKLAYNSLDARGLMQIRVPIWFNTLKNNGLMKSWKDFYDPERNIHSGVFILNLYRKECNRNGNVMKCMLQRYNGDRGGYKYYMKVMKSIRQFHKLNNLKLEVSNNINTIKFGVEQIRLKLLNLDGRFVVDLSGLRKNSIKQQLQTTQIIVLM